MQDQDGDSMAASHSRYTRRYWRRTDEPASWWPWGLLPLLGLCLLFLYGLLRTAPVIQADVEMQVSAALGEQDIDVRELQGDGQIVNVVASAPEAAKTSILGIARFVDCDTWLGKLRCPSDINLKLLAPENPLPVEPSERFHNFEYTRVGETSTLRGEVASADVRDAILKSANERFDNVVDAMSISSELATRDYVPASDRGLMLLEKLDRGTVRWTEGILSATGQVQASNDALSRAIFRGDDGSLALGDLDLTVISSISGCNEEFVALLSSTSIQFRTASAIIDDRSKALLEELAGVAKNCPGQIVIEGHTDAVGGEEANQTLSFNRAEAVSNALAALGVSSSRLLSIGYGEGRPVASNETPVGRAQNRRIAIRIAEADITTTP